MPETATIPETFEVPTDALVDAVAYFFHLENREGILNGRASTPSMDEIRRGGLPPVRGGVRSAIRGR